MSDTIFHKIIRREIPAEILHETDELVAIRDINPQAPTHILIIPKRTIPQLTDLRPEDGAVVGELVLAAKLLAEREGIAEAGYRLVFNCGSDGQQTVPQLHLHLLGGRNFHWPPG